MLATRKFGGSDQDWQFNPGKQKLRYIGIRKKSKMDQVGQLGVPTSWLSPYYQREVYSSRRPSSVLRLLLWCYPR